MTSYSLDTVLIGLETTSVYDDNLFNRKIHVLNPKQVNKFKEAYNDLPKNDYINSLSLLTIYVSIESTNRYTSVTIVTNHFRTLRLVFRMLKDNHLYTSAE